MEQAIKQIKHLYLSYGFEYREDLSTSDSLVFVINQGFFDNAIIVELQNRELNNLIVEDVEALGFNVKKVNFSSINQSEKELFSKFFSIKKTKASFSNDYASHIKNIIKAFPTSDIKYSYIHTPFFKDSVDYDIETNILADIHAEIKVEGPKLILIEAPAGFGKTCTAYEVAKIISDQEEDNIVLFAELSRDRHAKIFNHVLHKEVGRSFPAVSPDLVIKEIKSGKIIVILDGFDELLNEKEDEKFQFEKYQAMLETIGDILESNAKVVLTTRKTAILQGDDFDEWISSSANQFEFVRYSLKEPSTKNWLDNERSDALKSARVNIKNFSNPVLLTFLKFINNEYFEEILKQPDTIVEKYFDLILKREIERQTLKLDVLEQSELLKRLSQYMMQYNFTKVTKDELIQYFSIYEIELIETCRSRYNADDRPTFEEMLDKLSNHALLDRSALDDKIGFINDFVLGHFVGIDLLSTKDEWLADSIFVEAAVNTFSSRALETRHEVWNRLHESLKYLNEDERVRLELTLLDRVTGNYYQTQFTDITFNTQEFFQNARVQSCYFNECKFINCNFNFLNFKNNTFISCVFYNCSSENININNEFISPELDEVSRISLLSAQLPLLDDIHIQRHEDQIKAYILEKFWPVGKETVAFAHRPLFIFYRGGAYLPQDVTREIEELRRAGLITSAKRKNWIGIDLSGHNFQIIRDILGR